MKWKILIIIGVIMILAKNSYAGELNYTGNFSTTAANANPWGVTANETAILVSDSTDDVIYTYTHAGVAIDNFADGSTAGTALRGLTTNGINIWDVKYNNPAAVLISKLTMSGVFVSSFSGTAANIDGIDICTDGRLLYVTDLADSEVYKYNLSGSFKGSWDTAAAGATDIRGIACSNTSNSVYVADTSSRKIYKFAKNNGTANGTFFDNGKQGSQNSGFGMNFNSSRMYLTDASTKVIHIFNGTNRTSDTTPPVISSLTNATTTNESVRVTFTTDEATNESNNTMGVYSSFVGVWSSLNQTLGTSHSLFITNLSNGTRYNFNTTAYDSSGNKASANFSFVTAFNAKVTDPCSATCNWVSGNWIINDGCICNTTTSFHIHPNDLIVSNGGLNIIDGTITSRKCYGMLPYAVKGSYPNGKLLCNG